MNSIEERFRDAGGTDMPPSRLMADDVYAAAWSRRRRRIEVVTAGAVIVGLLAAVVGIDVRSSGGDGAAGDPEPSPTNGVRQTVEPFRDWPKGTRDGQVVWATTTAGQLYAVITRCAEDDCTTQLLGSGDAGATWTVRQADFGKGADWHVTAPAAGVLYRTVTRYDKDVMTDPTTREVQDPKVSADGGRSWTDLRVTEASVPAVPANGWLECESKGQDGCRRLLAVDPDTARKAPLANVPDLELNTVVNVPATAGFWVVAYDREAGRPVVAVSGDRGRTWTAHTFAEAPRGTAVLASSVDGVTGYAVLSQYHPGQTKAPNTTPGPATSTNWVYRTGDAGRTWQRVDRDKGLPTNIINAGGYYVATDGTHFVQTQEKIPQRWHRSSGDGRSYRTGGPTGLGDRLVPMVGEQVGTVTVGPGSYVAFDDAAVYHSTDGLRFTRTPVDPPR